MHFSIISELNESHLQHIFLPRTSALLEIKNHIVSHEAFLFCIIEDMVFTSPNTQLTAVCLPMPDRITHLPRSKRAYAECAGVTSSNHLIINIANIG